jgi:hypothetical protein
MFGAAAQIRLPRAECSVRIERGAARCRFARPCRVAFPAVSFLLSTFFRYDPLNGVRSRETIVYQKAIAFADAVCAITRELPRGYFFLDDQLSATEDAS